MLLATLSVVCEAVLLLVLLGVPALAMVVYYDPAVRRNLALARAFPQPSALPVIGHLLHIVKPREEIMAVLSSLRATLGSRFVLTLFGKTLITVADPQAVEVVLSSSKHTAKGPIYELLKPWLGQGLLTSQGALWHSRRKLLTPAFHFRILGQFAEHLQQHAQSLADELDAARLRAKQAPVDVAPIISRATLRTICVTAMGRVDFQTDALPDAGSEERYFDAVHRMGLATVTRIVRPWLWPGPLYKLTESYRTFRQDLRTLHGFTAKVIADRKKALREDGTPKDAVLKAPLDSIAAPAEAEDGARRRPHLRPFLDVLLTAQRDGADLTDRAIREEVDTFMFEGHDTTSVALGWALELLGRHADAQARLAEELQGAAADWESVSKLPYLDRVLKECLRLRPSVPFIARCLDTDAVLDHKQVLPAGAVVHVSIYELHRHPDHFPDPERFDPDRFLPEAEQARHPFAYVPFSAGPRNCIGKRFALMELKLMLAAVLRRFRVRSAMADTHGLFVADLVLRPRCGVLLELTPR